MERSMVCSAAMNSIMWKPKYFHTTTTRIGAEGAVLEDEAVVVEADPVGRRAEAVPVEARIPGGLADRQHHEQREQQQRRRQEEQDGRELADIGDSASGESSHVHLARWWAGRGGRSAGGTRRRAFQSAGRLSPL